MLPILPVSHEAFPRVFFWELGISGSWGALAIIVRELGSKLLIHGSWGALSEDEYLNCFVGFLGALYIYILPLNSIGLVKNTF